MIRRQSPRIAEIERDRQRILVANPVAWVEIESREEHVVAFGDAGVGMEPDQSVPRIRVDDDATVLIPLTQMLLALRVARPGQEVAGTDAESQDPNQYTLRYRSSSHSLTFPMYSCHSPRLASTNRS